MPQIVAAPDLLDNPIVFANPAFQNLCGYAMQSRHASEPPAT